MRLLTLLTLLCSLLSGIRAARATPITNDDSLNCLRCISADSIPALYTQLSISVKDLAIKDLLEGIAESSGLGIAISPGLTGRASLFAEDVSTINILEYLSRECNLVYTCHPGLIHASNRAHTASVQSSKKLVSLSGNGMIEVNLHGDSLMSFASELRTECCIRLLLAEGLVPRRVSALASDPDAGKLLFALSRAWGLRLHQLSESVYLLEDTYPPPLSASSKHVNTESLECRAVAPGILQIRVSGADPGLILMNAAAESGCNLLLGLTPSIRLSLNFERISFPQLISHICQLSGMHYETDSLMYRAGMMGSGIEVYRFSRRSVNGVLEAIPPDLLVSASAMPFREQNLMILHGPAADLSVLRKLLVQLDDTVPMVLLELSIVEYNKQRQVSTGINASFDTQIKNPGGNILPGVDLELNTHTINSILSMFHGIGWYNLGYLSPDLDLTLSALEKEGMLRLEATPRLSALSGHEATMSIGETEYYVEERNDVIGTQNPQNIQTRQYKSVDADFSLKITPLVTGDGRIILSIELEQSDFTNRITPDAPPGKVSRRFSSTMSISNGQTLVLGGLGEKSLKESSQGIPLLNRIPVLKWLFSSRDREKGKSELIIFIKPVIT